MNLESIWAEYRSGLKIFLHSKVSNPADVDDLLQEILIKTHQHLGSIHGEKSVKSWLFQVASYTIIDFYRGNARLKMTVENQADQADNWENGTDSETIKQELALCIEPSFRT